MALSQGCSWLLISSKHTAPPQAQMPFSEAKPTPTRAHTCTTYSIELWPACYMLGCTESKPDERNTICNLPELPVVLAVLVPALVYAKACLATPVQCSGHASHADFTSESSFSKSLSLLAAAIASSAFCFECSVDTPLLPCSLPVPLVTALLRSCGSRQPSRMGRTHASRACRTCKTMHSKLCMVQGSATHRAGKRLLAEY